MRIGFLLPDISKPVGGLSAAYRFARYLGAAGQDVAILHSHKKFRYDFEDAGAVPIRTFKSFRATCTSEDVLVVPEIFVGLPQLTEVSSRYVVLNQNAFYTGPAATADALYQSPRTLGVAVTSDYIQSYLGIRFRNVVMARIRLGIDASLFRPAARAAQRKRVVAWMPRKRVVDAQLVVDVLRDRLAATEWSFEPIDGLRKAEVADRLSRADVFLSFSEREGFGLPVAEAMAAGAACVGFTGVGGNEIFTPDTGWPIPEGDVAAFLHTAMAVCRLIEAADPEVTSRTGSARALIAKRFTPTIERQTTLDAFAALLGATTRSTPVG